MCVCVLSITWYRDDERSLQHKHGVLQFVSSISNKFRSVYIRKIHFLSVTAIFCIRDFMHNDPPQTICPPEINALTIRLIEHLLQTWAVNLIYLIRFGLCVAFVLVERTGRMSVFLVAQIRHAFGTCGPFGCTAFLKVCMDWKWKQLGNLETEAPQTEAILKRVSMFSLRALAYIYTC